MYSEDIEEWKSLDFLGFPKYQISTFGRVCGPRGILHNCVNHGGYLRVSLYGRSGIKNSGISRLVALAFIPNPEELPEVNHKYGNKFDNHANRLEWCTPLQNIHHAHATGLVKKREVKIMADEKKDEKFLGASVPEELHRDFKVCAIKRGESMQEAIMHAARLYVDVKDDNGGKA